MTGSFGALGRGMLAGAQDPAAREAALIDLVVGMVLALEPLEHKQHGAGEAPGDAPGEAPGPAEGAEHAPAAVGASAAAQAGLAPDAVATSAGVAAGREAAVSPTLVAQSTQRMLAQMRAVLDREAARLGVDGVEGKAAVDQVSLIARTLEKIDQMERLITEDQARTTARTLSADEREQLRQTVRQLILAAAERLAAERREGDAGGAEAADGGARVVDAGASPLFAAPGLESPDPADAGSLDPGSRPG